MLQRLDAEDALAFVSAALQRFAALVEAQRGRVLKFTGDGLKAAFGMARAHEDDAELAVRAGLAILAEIPRHEADMRKRFGIEGLS